MRHRPLCLAALALVACKATLAPGVAPPPDDPSDAWDAVLAEVVDADGYVDYDRLEARGDTLDAYVAWLNRGRIPLQREDRLAYFVNAHNALVLWLVLEEGRPASVLDVAPTHGLPAPAGYGFFHQRQFPFAADRLSLAAVVNQRIRFPFQDVRAHAALSDGTSSAPPLRAGLYEGKELEAQLDAQMGRWVDDPERGVRVEAGHAILSPVFATFERDFTAWTGGRDLCTVASWYASEPLASELVALAEADCPHRFAPVDGRLNHRPRPGP